MRKKINILTILAIFLVAAVSLSQQQNWVNNYTFNGYDITQIQFLNPKVGFVSLQSGNEVQIHKTTDKGRTWNWLCTFNKEPGFNEGTFFLFTDELNGYRAYPYHDFYSVRTNLNRTTNGGQTWSNNLISFFAGLCEQPVIIFTGTTGYLYVVRKDDPFYTAATKVLQTNDGFETFDVICDQAPPSQYRFKLRDVIFGPSESIIGVGYDEHQVLGNTDYYRLWYDGQNFTTDYGQNQTYLRFLYGAMVNPGLRYLGVQSDNNNYPGTRFYTDIGYQYGTLIDQNTEQNKIGGLSFSDGSKGFTTIKNKVYITNNSGNSWTQDGTLSSEVNSNVAHHLVKSFGDVCYAASTNKFHTREIAGIYNTMYDWQQGSGAIAVDGVNIGTPSSGYFRGGDVALYTNPYVISGSDTTARFYYWGGNCNLSMNWNNSVSYLVNSGTQINADFKTKQKSTAIDALQNANQVKVLKDTNGVNNLIYESMGGIFYTRTKPGGDFKTEEIVSGTSPGTSGSYATFNNSNPYISEIKYPTNFEYEKNIIVCWEQREGNNIKIYEGFRNQTGPYWHWLNGVIHTLYNAPEGFKCFPKLYMSHGAYELRTLTFLEPIPNSTNKKLVGKVYKQGAPTNPEFEIIPAQNIQEYAVASIPELGQVPVFNQYIAYRLNQSVCYKRIKIGWDGLTNSAHYSVVDNEYNVSYSDNSFWRASVDISLKNMNNSSGSINMQPVITYQGQYDTRITRDNAMGAPVVINAIYYPIYVKERLANGTWSSSSIIYNSLNNPQFRPNIIGSKHNNSCILSYGKTQNGITNQYQAVPRWNAGLPNQFVCYPNNFPGLDAALLKGALVGNTASQNTMKITPDGQIYKLEKTSFDVMDINNIEDANFQTVNGVVVNDDVRYSFNLGNIIVNSNSIGFSNDIDSTIDDSGEWNENMQSLPFLLSNNDTLIIGRNASYILDDPNGDVQEIEYWVNLINKTTNTKHRELAHDTLRAGDSIQIEFLEGFIIDQISGGSDSFYVRLEIDTIDGDFGIGGGKGGDDGGDGDNLGFKRKIFWENERPGNSISSNIPTKFELYQNYPNPFNPATTIKYDLPKDVNVSIKVYDLLGKQVDILVNNETKIAGRYEVIWNAMNYASGLYIFRIEAGDFVQTKKMILLK